MAGFDDINLYKTVPLDKTLTIIKNKLEKDTTL